MNITRHGYDAGNLADGINSIIMILADGINSIPTICPEPTVLLYQSRRDGASCREGF